MAKFCSNLFRQIKVGDNITRFTIEPTSLPPASITNQAYCVSGNWQGWFSPKLAVGMKTYFCCLSHFRFLHSHFRTLKLLRIFLFLFSILTLSDTDTCKQLPLFGHHLLTVFTAVYFINSVYPRIPLFHQILYFLEVKPTNVNAHWRKRPVASAKDNILLPPDFFHCLYCSFCIL